MECIVQQDKVLAHLGHHQHPQMIFHLVLREPWVPLGNSREVTEVR
jgi:hypothetical protein